MTKTCRLGHRMIAYILLISLSLQSCGELGNTPIIPIQEEQTERLQPESQQIIPRANIQTLVDQTVTAQGGHAVTFYEEANGEIKASVAVVDDRHRVYNGVPVLIEKGTALSSLLHLPKRVQQNHIHIQQDKRGQFTVIVIQKTSGLMGGEESEDEGQKKRDTIRKGKEKANDDQYYEDDEQEE